MPVLEEKSTNNSTNSAQPVPDTNTIKRRGGIVRHNRYRAKL